MITQKFYSELLNRYYDTEKEAIKAEKEYNNQLEQAKQELAQREKKAEDYKIQRAAKAKEVEDAFKLAEESKDNANNLLDKFIKEYGSFHTTITNKSIFESVWEDFLNVFNKF